MAAPTHPISASDPVREEVRPISAFPPIESFASPCSNWTDPPSVLPFPLVFCPPPLLLSDLSTICLSAHALWADVRVAKTASVRDLKDAVEDLFSELRDPEDVNGSISW